MFMVGQRVLLARIGAIILLLSLVCGFIFLGISEGNCYNVIRKEASTRTASYSQMSSFERQIAEQGLRLLPYDHPFVVAYEMTYGIEINSYIATIGNITVSGVPFEFGGAGRISGFSERWWKTTNVKRYPVSGLDCAEYIVWIYKQLGYDVPDSSTALFFAGTSGINRKLPGIREHFVLATLEDALIGDVAYNSERYTYRSGHGSHTQLYFGTANKLGISQALKAMYADFPCDAHLVLDCGWSDGDYYYEIMRALKVPGARRSMAGTGVQFFTSIKAGSDYLYRSPKNVYKWTNPDTGHTFRIESRLEANGRLLQYKPRSKAEYPINISRPIIRPDA